MKYNFEADWKLLDTCNYRCAYCFDPASVLGSKLRTFASPPHWQSAFDSTGHSWLLHITGGEPSLYPGFVDLCERLTQKHYISINSNLTHPSFADFATRIDPKRVSFINAGFHIEERERKTGLQAYLRHAELLRAAGFFVIVSLVATPSALERFPEAAALLAPTGFTPVPKLLRENHEGRKYPQAYSEVDRVRFRRYAAMARKAYQPTLARMMERPSINMFEDDRYLEGLPSFLGRTCDAGMRFVQIKPNGDVFRCGHSDKCGNILIGTFAPRPAPAPCNAFHCYYFCNKYIHPDYALDFPRPLATAAASIPLSVL